LGVKFTYPAGKFNDAKVTLFFFYSTNEQKMGGNYMLGSWQGVNGTKRG